MPARWNLPYILTSCLTIALSGLAGCGSGKLSAPSGSDSPVIVGSQLNSLPAPPAQSNVNTYAGVGVAGGEDLSWNWYIAHPNRTYNYQQQQGVSSSSGTFSTGIFSSVGDFQYFADDSNYPYTLEGLNVEINGGVSLLEPAFTGFPTFTLAVGVAQQETGCLAPNGKVGIDFLQIPGPGPTSATVATDALFAHADLTYKGDTFSYSNIQQMAFAGAAASTHMIPFADSYCIQADAGYGLESTPLRAAGGSESMLAYLGSTGVLVGVSNGSSTGAGILGIVEPSAAIDLSSVTAGSYRGFYDQDAEIVYQDPAYFGKASPWVTAPVFPQTAGTLVGGYEDFYTFEYAYPEAPVTGNIRIDFGAQDSSHAGLFPAASITEPDLANACKSSQQTTGADGNTYCTFPVAALIGKSYGKYEIFISGPEPTTGFPLFYALLQD